MACRACYVSEGLPELHFTQKVFGLFLQRLAEEEIFDLNRTLPAPPELDLMKAKGELHTLSKFLAVKNVDEKEEALFEIQGQQWPLHLMPELPGFNLHAHLKIILYFQSPLSLPPSRPPKPTPPSLVRIFQRGSEKARWTSSFRSKLACRNIRRKL